MEKLPFVIDVIFNYLCRSTHLLLTVPQSRYHNLGATNLIKIENMNSKEFLKYYNQIDAALKTRSDRFETFAQKVKNSKNRAARKNHNELLSYGELRNAIVHHYLDVIEPIAEPHITTLEDIKRIHDEITNPKKVIPTFHNDDIAGAHKEDYINNILIKMREHSFSQFPVYDESDNVIEVISTNTIARWIANILTDKGEILIDEAKVKDFIEEIEFKQNYKFIQRNATVYDAYYLFIDEIKKNKRNLEVLFITESGKPTEKLLGMITIEDIARVMSEVDRE